MLKRVLRERAQAMVASGPSSQPPPAPAKPPAPAPGASAAAAAPAAPPRIDVAALTPLYEVQWAPRAAASPPAAAGGSLRAGGKPGKAPKRMWLVCGGEGGPGDEAARALSEALNAAGQVSEQVPVSAFLSRGRDTVAALADTLRTQGSVTFVHTWPLSLPGGAADPQDRKSVV